MPIIAVWMRLGTRGDDLRWERVMFVVLTTKEYKLLLGMDYLANRQGSIDSTGKKLTLEKEGVLFTLPLMEKKYVYRSTALKEFGENNYKQISASMMEVNELVQMGELERIKNSLDPEEAKYANEAGLVDIL